MAIIQQLKEDLIHIRWGMCTSFRDKSLIEVIIREMEHTCKLSCSREKGYGRNALNFEVQLVATQGKKNTEVFLPKSIFAMQLTEKQLMRYDKSRWTATFSNEYPYCSNCCGAASVSNDFEILIRFEKTKTNPKHVVVDQLLNLWKTKSLADITFNLEYDGTITKLKAHSQIVASGSPILVAMLQEKFKEGTELMATMKNVNPVVFEKFLRFIYTGLAELDTETVSDLLRIAQTYAVESLKEECAVFMATKLTVENAVEHLVLSHVCDCATLQRSTLDFMSKNAKVVCSRKEWLDVIKQYPELSFVAMQNMTIW